MRVLHNSLRHQIDEVEMRIPCAPYRTWVQDSTLSVRIPRNYLKSSILWYDYV